MTFGNLFLSIRTRLHFKEPRILAAAEDEVIVGATLDNFAAFQHILLSAINSLTYLGTYAIDIA